MTSIADLVRALHDIDAVKGRACGNCVAGNAGTYAVGLGCRWGHAPASREDGCEDFLRRPGRALGIQERPKMFHGISTPFHGRGEAS